MSIEAENQQIGRPIDLQENGLCSNKSLAMYAVKLSETHKIAIPFMRIVSVGIKSIAYQRLDAIKEIEDVEIFCNVSLSHFDESLYAFYSYIRSMVVIISYLVGQY